MPKIYGLIGYPLGHSFSKYLFEDKFRKEGIISSYDLMEFKDIELAIKYIKSNSNIWGVNVTIPHKIGIMPFLDKISEEAKAVGAVNTVKVTRDKGKCILEGYNTDVFGFASSFENFVHSKEKALVLGSGGASKAVTFVLANKGIDFVVVSRSKKDKNHISYSELNGAIQDRKIIINTSPLGMFPNIQFYPDIPYDEITNQHFLFDLIYNPQQTVFLKKGAAMGAKTINGMNMLIEQANKSWEIWNNY